MLWKEMSVRALAVIASVVAVMAVPGGAFADDSWPSAGQNIENTRHQKTESTLDPTNVGGLVVKWQAMIGYDVSATPAVEGNFIYVTDWGIPSIGVAGHLTKLDRHTGAIVWQRSLQDYTGLIGNLARTTPAIHKDLLIFGDQGGRGSFIPGQVGSANLLAVDKNSGDLVWSTRLDSHYAAIITQSATVFQDVVYVGVASLEELFAAFNPAACCSFRGSMAAVDANTGAILWQTYTAPAGYAGNAIWGSSPAIDKNRKQVYIATGNNYSSPDAFIDCFVAAGDDNAAQLACIDPQNYFDAIMAFDMDTGAVNWSNTVIPFDVWTVACIADQLGLPDALAYCPDPAGPDFDFGQAPLLMKVKNQAGKNFDLVGAGQKSGIFWALNPDTGDVVWSTQVSPGGVAGGLQWGSAFDGERIYTSSANSQFLGWTLLGGAATNFGIWSALDPATGAILWQTDNPAFNRAGGAISSANGVVYACSLDPAGHLYAMDAATGAILWDVASGGSCNSGAAIADGTVFWGSGYLAAGLSPYDTSNPYFTAYALPE